MNSNIFKAFNSIRTEEKLKDNTMTFLKEQIQKQSALRRRLTVKRVAIAFAAVFTVFFATFAFRAYFTETMFVDIDVNPSFELSVNRFDKVIGSYAYNADGIDLLAAVNVKHKPYTDAIAILVDVMIQKGYASGEGLISVTIQSQDGDKGSEKLYGIETIIKAHYTIGEIEAFQVSDIVRNAAVDLDLTPAMYLAIQDLQAADPAVTVDSCRGHSIRELRRMTEEHHNTHHVNGNESSNNPISQDDGDSGNSIKAGNNLSHADDEHIENNVNENQENNQDSSQIVGYEENSGEGHESDSHVSSGSNSSDKSSGSGKNYHNKDRHNGRHD